MKFIQYSFNIQPVFNRAIFIPQSVFHFYQVTNENEKKIMNHKKQTMFEIITIT